MSILAECRLADGRCESGYRDGLLRPLLAALLRPWPLRAVLARALVGYRAGGHRRRVQERLDDRLKFRTRDFGNIVHDFILRLNLLVAMALFSVHNQVWR